MGPITKDEKTQFGLVLSGGGARGAFQVGVLKAILKICKKNGIEFPFKNISGVSAGAINGSFLGCYIDDTSKAIDLLEHLWGGLRPQKVFHTDLLSVTKQSLNYIHDLTFGSFIKQKRMSSLLDSSPLRKTLMNLLPLEKLRDNIQRENLDVLTIAAVNYSNSLSVTYIESKKDIPLWERTTRYAQRTNITIDHVLASSSIPMFFSPIKIGNSYYGDGCLRNTAPLSGAIHTGANQLMIVGVRKKHSLAEAKLIDHPNQPNMAKIMSVVLNAVLLDGIDIDIERLSRINKTITQIPENKQSNTPLRPINFTWVQPSQDMADIAIKHSKSMPRMIRYLIEGLGEMSEAADILSYLLFHGNYCKDLIQLGYEDGLKKESEIESFLNQGY